MQIFLVHEGLKWTQILEQSKSQKSQDSKNWKVGQAHIIWDAQFWHKSQLFNIFGGVCAYNL